MALNFTLVENKLTDDPEDYYARIQHSQTVDQKKLIERMTLPGGMTKAHAKAVLTEYHTQLTLLLNEGYTVNDGLVRYRPGITGSFITEEDSFDPVRHKKTVNISATKELKDSVSDMEIERIKPRRIKMEIHYYIDLLTEGRDLNIVPGHMSMIKGEQLTFDKSDTAQGIFLIDADQNETRCTEYGIIKPSSIIFNIPPDIPKGVYDIIVRSRKGYIGKLYTAQFNKYLQNTQA